MTTRRKESTRKISRRRFIQTVGAATVAATTSGLAAAAPLEAIGPQDASADTNDIFPILALWLAMTTNETFVGLSPADLAAQTGRSNTDVQNAITGAKTKQDLYKQIRKEFDGFRTSLGYSGPQCPRVLKTLNVISQSKLPA